MQDSKMEDLKMEDLKMEDLKMEDLKMEDLKFAGLFRVQYITAKFLGQSNHRLTVHITELKLECKTL